MRGHSLSTVVTFSSTSLCIFFSRWCGFSGQIVVWTLALMSWSQHFSVCSPGGISLNFQPAASELSASIFKASALSFLKTFTLRLTRTRTHGDIFHHQPAAVCCRQKLPPEEFRCLSALPEDTWRGVVPILSVLGSRDSNQQLYLHLSSVFWPLSWLMLSSHLVAGAVWMISRLPLTLVVTEKHSDRTHEANSAVVVSAAAIASCGYIAVASSPSFMLLSGAIVRVHVCYGKT